MPVSDTMQLVGWKSLAMFTRYKIVSEKDLVNALGVLNRVDAPVMPRKARKRNFGRKNPRTD